MRNENEIDPLEKLSADLGRHANSIDVTPRPGFKEALRLRLRDAIAVPARMSHRFYDLFSLKSLAVLSPVLAVIVIAVLVFQPFYGVKTAFAMDQFTLAPESSDSAGVAADSAFLLTSRDPVVASDIEKLLVAKTDENAKLSVTQVDDRTLKVAFDKPLASDEIVKFALPTTTTWPDGQTATREYNWAFQAKGDFQVTGMIPGDKVTGLPLDAGIEFTFNYENIDKAEFQKAFSIEPSVAGHVESSRRTFVFVPEKLAPLTAYTVTLKGTLPLIGSSETLGDDVKFAFETAAEGERGTTFDVQNRFVNVTPSQTVAMPFYYGPSDNAPGNPVPPHVKLYRYASKDAFVAGINAQQGAWRATTTADDFYDTKNQKPAQEFDAQVTDDNGQSYAVFPATVPDGFYIADITEAGVRAYAFLVSSDLTSYVSRATNKTLFWVNDAVSGKPVQGATVGFLGNAERGTTDAQGIGSVATSEGQGSYVDIRSGDQTVFMPFDGSGAVRNVDNVSQGNWTYLYTDRPTYKPTDTMRFWGYIERRDDAVRPSKVTADVGFAKVDVDVTKNGTFSGTIDIKNVDPSYYPLQIVWDGQTVATRTVNVSDYVMPAYTLAIEPDTRAVFVGDKIGYAVHGAFFEGTPVSGLEVHVTGDCGLDQVVTLDVAGNAHGSFSCDYENGQYYPMSKWMNAVPNRPEEGQISGGNTVLVFGPKVYVDASYQNTRTENGVGTVEATIRNTQAVDSQDPLVFGPTTRSGQAVSATVTEITYVRHEMGQTYDFVRKEVIKQYSYERVEKNVAMVLLSSDTDGVVRYQFPATNKEANYRVDLSATDELGRTDSREISVWQRTDFERYDSSNALSFNNDDVDPKHDQWNFPGYKIGEQVHVSVYQHGTPFAAPTGSNFLYYQAHLGIRETEITASPSYSFQFEAKDLPNESVYGVLFDHGLYQQVGQMGWWYGSIGFPVSYDSSQSKLTVAVTSDSSTHRPGDDVSLSVHVTDKGGAPVSAAVNMNVVDEAYYALYPEQVSPLQDLYRWVDDGVIATAVTESARVASMGAEKGGGGDRGLGRSIFKDTADFQVIETNSAGDGTMKFKLPDNITQWRVTAQALDAAGKRAGDTKIEVNATLPFFLTPVIGQSYLTGDAPTLIVRSSGTMVGLGDSVQYDITVPDVSFEQKTSAPAGDTVRFDLPALSLGTHNVTIDAKTDTYQDRITRTVTIVPSRLIRPVVASTTDVGSIAGATDRMTDLTFLDAGKGQYYGELQGLVGWWGDRADESLARVEAAQLLKDTFGEDESTGDFVASAYQDRGIKLLPYGSEDFDLSARVALLGSDTPFNEQNLAAYFQDKLDDKDHPLTPVQTAMAFAALSSLGEPVLAQFQRAVPTLGDDSDVRLWVAMGLHAAGNDESARTIYRDLVTKEGKQKDGYIYLPSKELESAVERTSLLAILAGGLNEPQRDQIHDYVTNMPTGDTTLPLERVLYVKQTLPSLIGEATEFSYSLHGERKSVTLVANGQNVLSFKVSPDDLSQLSIQVAKGRLQVVSHYDTALVDPKAPVDADLGVSRTFSVGNAVASTFKENDLIRVTLKYAVPKTNCSNPDSQVPCESYQLTDVLPSGLVAITPSQSNMWSEMSGDACADYPSSIIGQRVTFFVNEFGGNTNCHDANLLYYYARVVTPGTYVAEPAYIRSSRTPDMNNHSDASSLTITP